MSRLIKNIATECFNRPRQAKPIVISISEEVDILHLHHDRDGYSMLLKQRMCRELANHLMEKCNVFNAPDYIQLTRNPVVQMELTLNDRGAYENLIPDAISQGNKAGVKKGKEEVLQKVPYGFELDQWYE